jgi:hypothetical protein
MTSDEQEALSHQHSHGFWLVPLASGAFAVFDHPGGKLLHILLNESELRWMGEKMRERHEARSANGHRPTLNLEGIEL